MKKATLVLAGVAFSLFLTGCTVGIGFGTVDTEQDGERVHFSYLGLIGYELPEECEE